MGLLFDSGRLHQMIRLVLVPFLLPLHVAGMALGDIILLSRKYKPSISLVAHEIAHCAQWRELGWTFPFHYLAAWVRAGFSHRLNEFEIRAERAVGMPGKRAIAQQLLEEAGIPFDRY